LPHCVLDASRTTRIFSHGNHSPSTATTSLVG
jgi:hypothetical protein